MRFADLFRLALDNLRRNRTRSLLTLVGVTIGVAALLSLMSYGAGVQYNAEREFNSFELYNSLRITSSPSIFDRFGDIATASPEIAEAEDRPSVPLTDSLIATFTEIDGVLAAYPEVIFPAKVRVKDRSLPVQVIAIPMAFGDIAAYRPIAGDFFTAPTDTALLLAPSMARRLGIEEPETLVGQTITLETISLHIQGLIRAAPAIATGLTSIPLIHHNNKVRVAGLLPEDDQPISGLVRVILPIDFAQQMQKITFFSTVDLMMRDGNAEGYMAALVQLTDPDAYPAVRQRLEETGVYVSSFRDQFAQAERLFLIMDLALGVIGFIALLVATVGIANTMMMNVMERTREIGVMKAIGGDERDLQRLFLVESGTLGVVGGVVGLLVGWGITRLVQLGVNYYLHRHGVPNLEIFHVPWWLVAAILGTALLVSLLAGILPARRAARIEPIAALRSA